MQLSKKPSLIYATRRSPLALAQSRAFAARLSPASGQITLHEKQIVTRGDTVEDRSLAEIGGKGLFVKEIEDALLTKDADFAVHSLKDLPATLPAGLLLACIPTREDPRDAFISPRYRSPERLPQGARVGTSSLRRSIVMKELRPDVVVELLRGNVDTRLRKVQRGEYDAIILARAGLVRLGLEGTITQELTLETFLPAPGQGALGVECREGDDDTRSLLATVHDLPSAICVAAERGVLVALGGDCRTPLGAYAERCAQQIRLRAFVANPDGSNVRRAERILPWPSSEDDAREAGLALGATLVA